MDPRVSDIIEIIDGIAPFRLAEKWDNVGLQVGDPSAPATRIMVSLDPCRAAVDDATASGCNLLITHHPLIFKPIHSLNLQEPQGSILAKAIRNHLSIVSMHTNLDIAVGGVNDLLAGKLGIIPEGPVAASDGGEMVKISVFVPDGYEERVAEALFKFSGLIGNYRECSFRTRGVGTFRPLPGAEPFVGTVGNREYVDETRLEVLVRRDDLGAACLALEAAHPYEEPAYDLYPLLNEGAKTGLGRIGALPAPLSLERLALQLKEEFGLAGIRFAGDGSREIGKVAICGGSGASLLQRAFSLGADVLITGDVKYHDARDAEMLGIGLLDLGHFASEILMVKGVCGRLEAELGNRGMRAEIMACESERDPFRYS